MTVPHNDQLTDAKKGKFGMKWDLANYLLIHA